MSNITCTTVIMEQTIVNADYAQFHCPMDGAVGGSSTSITRELWDDLGSPTEITVAIRPGDLLNNVEAKVLRA